MLTLKLWIYISLNQKMIGELVVIQFCNGDIDRPFVVGRIHEGYSYPTKFYDKGKLPDTKKLVGIKSK